MITNENMQNMWKTHNKHKKKNILLRKMLHHRTKHRIQKQNKIRKIHDLPRKQTKNI